MKRVKQLKMNAAGEIGRRDFYEAQRFMHQALADKGVERTQEYESPTTRHKESLADYSARMKRLNRG